MKKVLLTGATGLIGKYAIEPLLNLGFEVFAVSSKTPPSTQGINWVKADLFDSGKIKEIFEQIQPEYLLHLAWDTTVGSYLESDLNIDWLDASLDLLEQFKINGGKRAVFAGTCFEYDFQDLPLNEFTSKINPISIYAKCKNSLNEQARLFSKENDISYAWGRIFYVYGENEQDARLFPYIINNLKQDKEVVISSGELIKDYMFAGDIASAFAKILDSEVTGNINICSGEPIKIKDIVTLIAKKLGKDQLVKFKDVGDKNQPKIIVGDNSRLINEVKFRAKYSLNEGINKII